MRSEVNGIPTMLQGDKPKPHRIRWLEAERELALRGFAVPETEALFPPRPKRQTAPSHRPRCLR